eukprot:Pompholyxophrys_punicea_v1_NODE_914_length_1143_cov_2.465993.p1 type:complete len:102 gc:universal NODE_914_length_1143_cov_2.465993:1108-803(-)
MKPHPTNLIDSKLIKEIVNSQNFTIVNLNVCSLKKYFEELELLNESLENISILALTEIRCNEMTEDTRTALFHLHNYRLITKVRKGIGGGVALYVKDTLDI